MKPSKPSIPAPASDAQKDVGYGDKMREKLKKQADDQKAHPKRWEQQRQE